MTTAKSDLYTTLTTTAVRYFSRMFNQQHTVHRERTRAHFPPKRTNFLQPTSCRETRTHTQTERNNKTTTRIIMMTMCKRKRVSTRNTSTPRRKGNSQFSLLYLLFLFFFLNSLLHSQDFNFSEDDICLEAPLPRLSPSITSPFYVSN